MTTLSTQDLGETLVELRLITPEQLQEAMSDLKNPGSKDLLEYFERRSLLTTFQIKKLEKGERTGYYLDHYKIIYQISAGTFARVFRAVDSETGGVVALKVLRSRHADKPDSVKQFHREAELTKQLKHPNIVQSLEVGVDRETNSHYLAMEFVEGGNLRELLRIRKKIGPGQMIPLAIQMVRGLDYALGKKVTHRDIKPTNILFSANGQIKWVDFGLGGVVEGNASGGESAQRTCDYAGLEKATGAPKGDPRSDIFFLGAVFYEMLAGEPPMLDTRDKNLRMQKSRFDGIKPLASNPDVATKLSVVVDKMLALKPDFRYQDYEAILNDLQGLRLEQAELTAVSGTNLATAGPPRVLVVHQSEKVQDVLRDALMKKGYQVMLTSDLGRALSIHKLRPAQCFVIDLDTAGESAVTNFESMAKKANAAATVFLATPGQRAWTSRIKSSKAIILEKPLKLGPVYLAVKKLAPPPPEFEADG